MLIETCLMKGKTFNWCFCTGIYMCVYAKHVPGSVPELEKTLGVVYQTGGEYFEGNKYD